MDGGKVHDFAERLAFGKCRERELDDFFGCWFSITPASSSEERRGIDRHFTNERGHRTVQYKADARADDTGRIFVETVSVDRTSKIGGHIGSAADWMAIYLPRSELIYWIKPETIRLQVERWRQHYRLGFAQNRGYRTYGLLVAQMEFERSSQHVFNMADYSHWRSRHG